MEGNLGEKRFIEALKALDKLSDDELTSLQFTIPAWQVQPTETKDADGFSTSKRETTTQNRETLQQECWNKFLENPFVGTSVRGQAGRVTGFGFDISALDKEIRDVITLTEYDPRNKLYGNWWKFFIRSTVEGELFLCLSLHPDGFVEVDFIDPSGVNGGDNDGVIYHPTKSLFPLGFFVGTGIDKTIIPSINCAYFPEMIPLLKNDKNFQESYIAASKRGSRGKYRELKGFYRFIVHWDRSVLTKRNISHLRAVLIWINHYETLKQYEIDHKKSAGAYLWVVTIEDPKSFRLWIAMTDEDRAKTGIMAKKTPGGTLVLPLGMKLEAISPKLPSISESDTDILHLISGGLNEPEDITTGQSKGTFASVKASRGPMSDRIADEIVQFDKFIRYDFYRAVFFLRSCVTTFPRSFKVREAVRFNKKKPVFEDVEKSPEFLIEVSYPVSEMIDAESRARAYLGVKHGSLYETLGIPNQEIARRIGFGNYRKSRLVQATEEDIYPDLVPSLDAESIQENKIEPKRPKKQEGKEK